MDQVTLQAIKLKQISRSKGASATSDNSSSDGFMQIIDNMLSNLVDGETTDIAGILTSENAQDTENGMDSSLLAMLSELLQSGNGGNLTGDISELLKNIDGLDGIDSVEIPNLISKLQENNFFEAMGMDEDTADTLYTLGNNTYDYLSAQAETVKSYINSKLETGDVATVSTATQTVMETGVMQNRVTTEVNNKQTELMAAQKMNFDSSEMPIISATLEKTSETVIQPTGVTVPNMISQRIVKADESALQQLSGNSNNDENQDFSSLSEIATTLNASNTTPEIELPKVQNLSNPLFDNFNISEQITDGVKANINLEKTEFTVKLNPESLGEVTIKLIEENGNMVVNITAASESTAKLLNSDLTALRDSLGSLNLEIREVTVEAPENIEESIAQFNMTSQQFSDRQKAFREQQQQDDKPYYAAQHGVYATEEVTADYTSRVRTAVDGLDTYV